MTLILNIFAQSSPDDCHEPLFVQTYTNTSVLIGGAPVLVESDIFQTGNCENGNFHPPTGINYCQPAPPRTVLVGGRPVICFGDLLTCGAALLPAAGATYNVFAY